MRNLIRQLEEAKKPKGPPKDSVAFARELVQMVKDALVKEYGVKHTQLPVQLWPDLQHKLEWAASEAAKLAGTGEESEVDFDLTEFKPGAWEKLMQKHGLKGGDRSSRPLGPPGHPLHDRKHNFFVWSGDGLSVETNNNPETGEYNTPEDRAPQKGYASYVNVRGRPDRVQRFVADFRRAAVYIKGEKND